MAQFFYTYVLLSEKDQMMYTGYTHDMNNRLSHHNAGRVPSTYTRRPLKLIYYEACLSRTDALNRERYLKTGMGKRYIRNRIKNFNAEKSNLPF